MINLPITFFKDMMGMAIILKTNLDLFKNNMKYCIDSKLQISCYYIIVNICVILTDICNSCSTTRSFLIWGFLQRKTHWTITSCAVFPVSYNLTRWNTIGNCKYKSIEGVIQSYWYMIIHVSNSDAKLCLTQFDIYEMLKYLVHMVLY